MKKILILFMMLLAIGLQAHSQDYVKKELVLADSLLGFSPNGAAMDSTWEAIQVNDSIVANYFTNLAAGGDIQIVARGTDKVSIYNPYATENDTLLSIGSQLNANAFLVDEDGDVSMDGGTLLSSSQTLRIGGATTTTLRSTNLFFQYSTDVSSGSVFNFDQSNPVYELTDTDGRQAIIDVSGEIDQSATGAVDGIYLNMIGTSFGDGSTGDGNNLLNLALDGTSKFRVDTDGAMNLTASDGDNLKISINTADQVFFDETKNFYFYSDNGEDRFHLLTGGGSNASQLNMYDQAEVLKVSISSNADTYFNGGNVGVGTTPSYLLDIYQDSPLANDTLFRIGTSDDADRFYVDEDGDVFQDGLFTMGGSTFTFTANGLILANILTLRGSSVNFRQNADLASGDAYSFAPTNANYELTDTDGRQAITSISGEIAQSATAAADGIYLNMTGTSFGDGSTGDGNNLLNLALDGTSKLRVDTDGYLYAGGRLYPGGAVGGTAYHTSTSFVGSQARYDIASASDFYYQAGYKFIGVSSAPLDFRRESDISSGHSFRFRSGTNFELTDTDAEQAWMYVEPKINQTSTANYVGLLMDVTETSLGSGVNELMALRVGGTDQFTVGNTGNVNFTGALGVGEDIWLNTNKQLIGSKLTFNPNADLTGGDFYKIGTATSELTDTDAEQAYLKIDGGVNQSGTANYVGFLMDMTENGTGSGTNELMALRVGGTDKFTVSNDGNATAVGALVTGLSGGTSGQVTFFASDGDVGNMAINTSDALTINSFVGGVIFDNEINLTDESLTWTNGADLNNDDADTLELAETVVKVTGELDVTGGLALTGAEDSGDLSKGLSFGGNNNGFTESSSGANIEVFIGGTDVTFFDASGVKGSNSNSFRLVNETPTGTNPTVTPNGSDLNTGIGHAGADQLSLIAGGVEGARIEATNATFAGTITENGTLIRDYAGIATEDNATATTIDLTDLFHKVTVFDEDQPEIVSDGDNTNDDITIGQTGDYEVHLSSHALSAGANKIFEMRVFEVAASGDAITGISQANPAVVTATGHSFSNGERVKISGVTGMTEVNDKIFIVANAAANTFELTDDEGVNVNSTGYTAYSAGGTGYLSVKLQAHSDRKFSVASDVGSWTGHGFNSLTTSNTIELYIKNETDATNITMEGISLTIQKL